MSLPMMDADPTAPARRAPVRPVEVTPTTTVRVALSVLAATGVAAMVVTDQGRLVGAVTAAALSGDGGQPPAADSAVADVMDYEVVRIAPTTDEIETLGIYQAAAWDSLRRRHPYV